MEPVTHLAAGLLTGQALSRRLGQARGLVPLCAAAAVIPDIDGLAGQIDPAYFLLYHRGVTHSIFGAPVLAFLLALLARRLGAGLSLRHGFCAAILALATHLFLDAATGYGTQLLAPFSTARYSFDALFVVDPFFTASLLGFSLLAWRTGRREPSRRSGPLLAALGLFWMLLYPGTCLLLRQNIETRFAEKLAAEGQTFEQLRVSPDALAPYYWHVLADTGENILAATIKAPGLAQTAPFLRLHKADRAELARLGGQAGLLRAFDWFAVYPVEERVVCGTGANQLRAVRFADARFVNTNPVVERLFGPGRVHAQITAILAPDGSLCAYRYENRPAQSVPPQLSGPSPAHAAARQTP